MGEHKVPTKPGWWWCIVEGSAPVPLEVVERTYRNEPDGFCARQADGDFEDVEWSGLEWLAPVLTPTEADALRHDLATTDAENDDAWDALGGLNVPTIGAGVRVLTARAEAAESTLALLRKAADALEWIGWRDLDSRSADEAHGMNVAGWRIRVILDGGDHE